MAPRMPIPSIDRLPLTLRAAPGALALLRERGLRGSDVAVLPGASGGAKWLGIAGLDRYVFGTLLGRPRDTVLHGIGSSIGSWRLACLGQRDPLAALDRGHEAYIHHQRYSRHPSTAEVTRVLTACLDHLLGAHGVDEILSHPSLRLHVITAEGHGFASQTTRVRLAVALGAAAAANVISRRTLSWHFTRTLFHNAGDDSPFAGLRDLPTRHRTFDASSLRAVLLASGSIPLLVDGVHIPGVSGMHWDGGVTDYHLAFDYGAVNGLVLYPHFYDHLVPGWFDKSLPWRKRGAVHDRLLLIAPSASFVASLPGSKIPDRRDFYALSDADRIARWEAVRARTVALGETLHELIETGRIADVVQPFPANGRA